MSQAPKLAVTSDFLCCCRYIAVARFSPSGGGKLGTLRELDTLELVKVALCTLIGGSLGDELVSRGGAFLAHNLFPRGPALGVSWCQPYRAFELIGVLF